MFPTDRVLRLPCLLAALAMCLNGAPSACAQQGDLEMMRADVRTPPAPQPPAAAESSSQQSRSNRQADESNISVDSDTGELYLLLGYGAVLGVTSPFWVPPWLLEDHYHRTLYFTRFPYERTNGYLIDPIEPTDLRRLMAALPDEGEEDDDDDGLLLDKGMRIRSWPVALRLSAEYGDSFKRMSRVGGNILLSTAWRFGLDSEWYTLYENLRGGERDELSVGDCNLVFRFAQSERAEFRTGLGFSWLDDARRTDYGVNFNYAFDIYPRKPWVFSGSLDLGTLGHTNLLHVRTTVGLLWRRWEGYTGYDLYDVGRVHTSSLIAGIRLWL